MRVLYDDESTFSPPEVPDRKSRGKHAAEPVLSVRKVARYSATGEGSLLRSLFPTKKEFKEVVHLPPNLIMEKYEENQKKKKKKSGADSSGPAAATSPGDLAATLSSAERIGDAFTDLRLLFLMEAAKKCDVKTFRKPEPKPGVPGKDRPVEKEDILSNLADEEIWRSLDGNVADRPDLVVVFHNEEEEGAAIVNNIEWDDFSDDLMERIAIQRGPTPRARYAAFRELIVEAMRATGLMVETRRTEAGVLALIWASQDLLEQCADAKGFAIRTKPCFDLTLFESRVAIPVDDRKLATALDKVTDALEKAGTFAVSVAMGVTDLTVRAVMGQSINAELFRDSNLEFSYGDRWMYEPFTSAQALQLIADLIDDESVAGGAEVRFGQLIASGKVKQVFPLRDPQISEQLMQKWIRNRSPLALPPLDAVRDYFGEKVAMYFAFLSNYTSMLLVPAIVGLIVFLVSLSTGRTESAFNTWFGFVLAVWITVFLEFWKRKSNVLSFRWGTQDFEAREETSSDFLGVMSYGFNTPEGFVKLNPETYTSLGVPREIVYHEPYFPEKRRKWRMVASAVIHFGCVVASLIVTLLIMWLRIHLRDTVDAKNPDRSVAWGVTSAGILQGVVNAVFEVIHDAIAMATTRWENHRTSSQFETILILKCFGFNIFNSYFSLYYTAFLKNHPTGLLWRIFGVEDKCAEGGCIEVFLYIQSTSEIIYLFITMLSYMLEKKKDKKTFS